MLWTTGQVLPVHQLREETGLPILVDGAQSVGTIPVDANGLDFYTISGQKWLTADRTGRARSSSPSRRSCASGVRAISRRQSYEADGAFEPRPGARALRSRTSRHRRSSPGFLAALDVQPEWRFERAAATAERCRELLREAGADVVVPDERATLVSWRVPVEESAAVVARLAEAGVIVRDLPGRGLVRASVGWWTSDEDLERLVAAL